ncbi:MAG: hypothetical protein AB7G06_06960 [Bdellovibrionales bacterium]
MAANESNLPELPTNEGEAFTFVTESGMNVVVTGLSDPHQVHVAASALTQVDKQGRKFAQTPIGDPAPCARAEVQGFLARSQAARIIE